MKTAAENYPFYRPEYHRPSRREQDIDQVVWDAAQSVLIKEHYIFPPLPVVNTLEQGIGKSTPLQNFGTTRKFLRSIC